jgi:hypothetical protein
MEVRRVLEKSEFIAFGAGCNKGSIKHINSLGTIH